MLDIKELRNKFKSERKIILSAHRNGEGGLAIVRRLTSLTDDTIREILNQALQENEFNMTEQVFAVISVGGYGRGELSPHSDIDLLILHASGNAKSAEYAANILIPALWDIGFDVGHGFRAIRETMDMSRQDMTVKSNIIHNRLIWGDLALHQKFKTVQWDYTVRKEIEPFIQHLEEMREGISSQPLGVTQPNIKEGAGGLRILQSAFWAAYARFGLHNPKSLRQRGILSEKDVDKLEQSLGFLLRVRNELHFSENKKNDTLAYESQQAVASALGYKGDDGEAVKIFMRDYFRAGSNIQEISDALFSRSKNYRKGILKKSGELSYKKIGKELALIGNEISLSGYDKSLFEEEPERILSIFKLCQDEGYEISQTLKTTLKNSLDTIDPGFFSNDKFQDFFISILKKRDSTKILRMMHACEILGRFLPEFEAITHISPYDFYHAYTIDEHTFQSLSHLEALEKQESGLLSDIYRNVEEKWIVKLTLLLHATGKYTEEKSRSHSQVSSKIAETVCKRLRISKEETDLVCFLIKHHLLLNLVARRRDTHDSKIIHQLASTIELRRNLDLLYLITYSDLKGVAPGIWSNWFAFLLEDLYERTADFLNIDESNRPGDEEKVEEAKKKIIRYLPGEIPKDFARDFLEVASTRYLISMPTQNVINHVFLSQTREDGQPVADIYFNEALHCTEMVMISENRRGHLNRISGVLASQGMNILEARIFMQRDNSSIDIIRFNDRYGKPIQDDGQMKRMQKKMVQVVGNMEPPKQDQSPKTSKDSSPSFQTWVDIKNNISPTHTVIEIEAVDRVGLIQSITFVLFKNGLNIHLAKIDTEGSKAIDAFYVTDKEGSPILDKNFLGGIKSGLLGML